MQFGPYTLLRKLATGGMAEVFLAKETRQSGLERYVVIKRIHPHLAENSEFLRAFLQEGKLGAQLQHPNIAQVFDMGQQDGIYFLSLEYVRGVDLVQIFRRAQRKRHRMTRELILRIAIDVLRALDYAHEATDIEGRPLRIIHRDVSPGNVLLGWDGTAKLVDFGIAKAASFDQHTRPGTIKGKIAYMAPEQILGDGPIDRRIDLFALGVILHELATGRRLFKADTEGRTMANVLGANIPSLSELRPDLPAPLCDLIHKALQRSPDQRFQGASDMLTEAERVANATGGLQPVRAELSLLLRDEGEAAEPEDPALAGLFVAPKAVTSSWSVSAFDLPALGRGIFPPPKGSGLPAAPNATPPLPAAAGTSSSSFGDGFDPDGISGLAAGGFQPEDFVLPDARESIQEPSPLAPLPPGLAGGAAPGQAVDMLGSLDDELPAPVPAAGPSWGSSGLPPPRGFDGGGDFAGPAPPSIQVIEPRQQPASAGATGGSETSFAGLLGDSSDRLQSPVAARAEPLPAPLPMSSALPATPALPNRLPGPLTGSPLAPPVPSMASGPHPAAAGPLSAVGGGSALLRDPQAGHALRLDRGPSLAAASPPLPSPSLDASASLHGASAAEADPNPVSTSDLSGVSLESREALLAAYAASTLGARAGNLGAVSGTPLGAGSPTGSTIGSSMGAPIGSSITRPEASWRSLTPAHGSPAAEGATKEPPPSIVRMPERPQFIGVEQPDSFVKKPEGDEVEKKAPRRSSRLRTVALALLALAVIGAGGIYTAERVGFGNARVGLTSLLEKVLPASNPDAGPAPGPEVASAGVADAGPAEAAAPSPDAGAEAEPAAAAKPGTRPSVQPAAAKVGATGAPGASRNGIIRLEVSATAEVDVDGQPGADAGLKVRNLRLAPGRHEVRVREPSLSAERTLVFEIQAGRQAFRRVQFGRGTLKLTAATGSGVRIDGRYVGRAPLDQLLLYEGPHRLEVEDPSSGAKNRREVRIQPGRTVVLNLARPAPTPP